MTVETHEVVLSFDQPGDTRNPLLSMLQQLHRRPVEKTSRAAALLGSQKVLIVDSQQGRAQYIAQLLSSAGFWPFVAPTSLDAYTLFLQGSFHPFAIILCEEGAANNQFFLTRLSQQFVQRYDWNVPFIRLQVPANSRLFASRSTGPLANAQATFPRPAMSPGSSPDHAGADPSFPPLQQPLRTQPLQPRSFRTQGVQHPLSTPDMRTGDPTTRAPSSGFPRPSSQHGDTMVRPPRSTSSPLRESMASPLRPMSVPPGEATARPSRSASGPLRPASAPLRTPTPTPASRAPEVPETSTSASRDLLPKRRLMPLPSSSTMKFTKKQAEKISLDGLSIGRYQLQTLIGGNPLGDVYVTYDRLREQDIALKSLQTNMIPFHLMEGLEEDYNLFQQEMDLLQNIEHPHVSRVMNIGKSYISGFPFIYKTMPYYAEGSLLAWLNRFSGRAYSPSEVARIILQIAEAIQFLHERGILYQNFKLTNVLVVNETEEMRDLHVVISDLPFVQDVINLPKTIESFRYIAPEQWEGESFTSSDQYSLAIMAYELLTGRAPFQGNSDTIMRRMHLTMHPPPPSSVNRYIYPFIDKVILRALSKQPGERFESVRAFATALERASN